MDSLQFLYLLAIVVVINIFIVLFLLFYIPQTLECLPDDEECASRLNELQEACSPPTTIIYVGNSTNNLTIEINRYLQDGKCYREEVVTDDSDSGITYYDIEGYSTTCAMSSEDFERFGQLACNGSLLPFVLPGSVEGGPGSGDFGEGGDSYQAYCSLVAEDCHGEAANMVKDCNEAEILMDQEIGNSQGGASFWTLYLNIQRLPERCVLYHELVNAVNLPPELPPQVVGMNMTCTVELSKFPISGISIRWCDGDLVDHLKLIYP
ncbi:MAG: hypothetical protein KAI64_02195 [Thermoplasmata archaeon]|nr:hypothetical protein [Thermoplasmata archaeon]